MKKLALTIAAAALIGFSGTALADPNPNSETTGNPPNGNQNCQVNVAPGPVLTDFKNPGALNKQFKAANNSNLKGVASFFDLNVGQLLKNVCGIEPL